MTLLAMMTLLAAMPLSASTQPGDDGDPGNSGAARQCQNNGWQAVVREDGSSFADQGECVSHGAMGGDLVIPVPTIDIAWSFLGGQGRCSVTITVSGVPNGEYTVGFDGLGTFGHNLVVTNGSGMIDGEHVADVAGTIHWFEHQSTVTAVIGTETATSFVSCQQLP